MARLHVVLSNDPAAAIVAAADGDVYTLSPSDPATWLAPQLPFVLWGAFPGVPAWEALARRADAVVCWADEHAAHVRAAGATALAPADVVGAHIASFFCPAHPTLDAAIRGRGLVACQARLGLPALGPQTLLVHRPELRAHLIADAHALVAAGVAAIRGDYAGRSVARAKRLADGVVAVENGGMPILVTALVLLREYRTVVQLLLLRASVADVRSRDAFAADMFKDGAVLMDDATATHARGHLRERVDMSCDTFEIDVLARFDAAVAGK